MAMEPPIEPLTCPRFAVCRGGGLQPLRGHVRKPSRRGGSGLPIFSAWDMFFFLDIVKNYRGMISNRFMDRIYNDYLPNFTNKYEDVIVLLLYVILFSSEL